MMGMGQQMGQMNPMNPAGQMLPQMNSGLNQMNPIPPINQMNFPPMNNFQTNPNFANPFQPNLNMGLRANQSFPNANMNPQLFMNPYQGNTGFAPNMMPSTNPMFMPNNMMPPKGGFMFQPGTVGVGNQMMAQKMSIFDMCQDQNGSRQIQQQFEHGNDQEKDNIYNSIQENILILMKDVFGNYVVQKMFEKGFVLSYYQIFLF